MMTFMRTTMLLIWCIVFFISNTAWANLTVGNYTLVSSKRVSRVEYEYTYRADITNNGESVKNVMAQVVSNSPNTVVIDKILDFGDVAAGNTVVSKDTFVIKQNRLYSINWSTMVWNIQHGEAVKLVGNDGVVIEITDTNSPIAGVSVNVPEGTFDSETLISIGYKLNSSNPPLPEDFIQEGVTISFEASNPNFNEPILIKIPFQHEGQDDDLRLVFTHNETSGEWETVKPYPSPDPNQFYAKVNHFSDYVKGIVKITSDSIISGFNLDRDTNRYENNGTVFCQYDPATEGICFGLSTLASTYFNNHAIEEGLYCRWDIDTNAAVACEIHGKLTMRTDHSVGEWAGETYNSLQNLLGWSVSQLDYSATISYLKYQLKKNKVVTLNLMGRENSTGSIIGHSVVVTGWEKNDATSGVINIYDVNDNSRFHQINYYKLPTITEPYCKTLCVYNDYYILFPNISSLGVNVDGSINNFPSEHICNAEWRKTSSLDTPINSPGAAFAENGYIYSPGGWYCAHGTFHYAPINPDGSLGIWQSTTSMPNNHHTQSSATSYNGVIYLVGGHRPSWWINDVYYAVPNSNGSISSWIRTTSLPTVKGGSGAFGYDGYLYTTGGTNGYSGGDNALAEVRYAFINPNGSIGTWYSTTPLPRGRTYHGATAYNGYAYIAGGIYAGRINALEVLYAPIRHDGTIGSWTITTPIQDLGSQYFTGCKIFAIDNYLYIFSMKGGNYRAILNGDGSLGNWEEWQPIAISANDYIGTYSMDSATKTIYGLGGRTSDGSENSDKVYYISLP